VCTKTLLVLKILAPPASALSSRATRSDRERVGERLVDAELEEAGSLKDAMCKGLVLWDVVDYVD